jgi:aminopeptidase N
LPVRVRRLVVGAAVVALVGCGGTPQVTTAPLRTPLPSEAEEPERLFPRSGSSAYDVDRYDLDLSYDPKTGAVKANAWMTATATERLDEISVDFGPMEIAGVTVNDVPAATIEQRAGKLHVTPAQPLAPGTAFVLGVGYGGVPEVRSDPLGSPLGWIRTTKGSYTNLAPNGSGTWLPTNDRPGDKALFRLRLTVPEPFQAVANGVPLEPDRAAGRVTTVWEMAEPMAPSELQITVGQLDRVDTTSPGGHVLTNFVAAGSPDPAQALALAGQIVDYYSQLFGPYPFAAAGLTVMDAPPGLAVAAQGRPLVSARDLAAPMQPHEHGVLSTALAHQWFGAAVTPARWQDVWLSEGFTTYARWLWMQEAGLQRVDDAAANALSRTNDMRAAFGPPDRPTAHDLASPAVADGGAVVLHALRETVGDARFFTILRRWVAEHRGQSVMTDAFIDHASDVVGDDLTGFFLTWLSTVDVPAEYPGAS